MSGNSDQKITSLKMRRHKPIGFNPAARRQKNTVDKSLYIPARILYPALGCPAVIDPAGTGSFATRGVCALIVCGRKHLSDIEVARHLRLVPWEDRHTRYTPPRSKGGTQAFDPGPLSVRRLRSFSSKGLTQIVTIGADDGGEGGVVLALSNYVRKFYRSQGLAYLHEIRVEPSDLGHLTPGKLYNLFWINEDKNDTPEDRSAEMDVLLRKFATRSRFGNDGVPEYKEFKGSKTGQKYVRGLLREYEYDFRKPESPDNRTEVLHPVYVKMVLPYVPGKGGPSGNLKLSHLTDLHVHIRADAYEANLKAGGLGHVKFNNWNKTCAQFYKQAKADTDVLLMTGDLIDYGRGYNELGGTGGGIPLGIGPSYWRDRNWFLFYQFLANGAAYQKPVFTNLGNHDWRLHPYGPFTPFSPSPKTMNLKEKELEVAHGKGSAPWWPDKLSKGPTKVTLSSVKWYLLLMNPFLDYAAPLPGGYDLLMLDWAREERNVFHTSDKPGEEGYVSLEGGPVAKASLTTNQRTLVEHFADRPGLAKLVGIHAPPIGPWPQHTDDDIAGRGFDPLRGTYGSIGNGRDWFIKKIYQHNMVVMSGHIHRGDVMLLRNGQAGGGLVARGVGSNWKRPADFAGQLDVAEGKKAGNGRIPLIVNTTSAGPQGSVYLTKDDHHTVESGYVQLTVAPSGEVTELKRKWAS